VRKEEASMSTIRILICICPSDRQRPLRISTTIAFDSIVFPYL
jgi:hypothetical protein